MTAPYAKTLAEAVLSLAEDAGMPDSYWATDRRIKLALHILYGRDDFSRTHVQELLSQ